MKKLFLSITVIAGMTFACQHDNVESVAVSPALSNLSADELRVANNTGSLVSASEAFSQATAYQKANPTSTVAVTFSREILETILNQPHIVGIRAYYVKNSEGELDLALVGLDKNLKNQYTANGMFSGGKVISSEKLKQQMNLFQTENPAAIRAVAFGGKVIADVLNQTNSAGLRFYFITDKNGNRNLMFVGADNQSKDIDSSNPNARGGNNGVAATNGHTCPQHCEE